MTQRCVISKILLPIDLSAGSKTAVEYCSSLAPSLGGVLTGISLLYVSPVGYFGRHMGNVDFRGEDITQTDDFRKMRDLHMQRDIIPLMEDAEKAISAAAPGVPVERIVAEGDPAAEIARVAEEGKYSTILIASRGLTEIKRLFLGSVTRKVIGYAHCDVLVVPPGAPFDFKTILVPTDGSFYSESAAHHAINLAKAQGGCLIALAVVPSGSGVVELPVDLVEEEGEGEAAAFVKKVQAIGTAEGMAIKGIITSGTPYEAIVDTAQEYNADLIVMGSHGRTGINKFLMGSVTEKVVSLSTLPVMVVKAVCV